MAYGIIMSIVLVGAVGCIIGFFLSFASEKFKVKVDEREEAVLSVLPGNNCGGCGYPGCSGLAEAIAKGNAPVGQCPVGGPPVASKIAKIMGVDAGSSERMVAFVKCVGTCEKAKDKYEYSGAKDCSVVALVPGGGPKACSYGCLGFGSCVSACTFDAIHIVNGISVVDKEACKACGACIKACPRHLIDSCQTTSPRFRIRALLIAFPSSKTGIAETASRTEMASSSGWNVPGSIPNTVQSPGI